MKVAVYSICRNEAEAAPRFIASCADADVVVVADTGSTDDSVAILRRCGAVVHKITVDPWRFDSARNAALDLVPEDVDVCISLDLDEVLLEGWRSALEISWRADTTRATYPFILTRQPNGRPARIFRNGRIHSRHGYRWRHACHEILVPIAGHETLASLDDLTVEHLPIGKRDKSSYLGLLRIAAEEESLSPRMAHLYGRELLRHGRNEEARAEFERQLALPSDRDREQRAMSMRYLAQIDRDKPAAAHRWLQQAVDEAPRMRDAWIDLAWHLYGTEEWHECFLAAVEGLQLPDVPGRFPSVPERSPALLDDLAAVSASRLGKHEIALRHAARASALDPTSDRIRRNLHNIAAAYDYLAPDSPKEARIENRPD